jgi:hypothetical protein
MEASEGTEAEGTVGAKFCSVGEHGVSNVRTSETLLQRAVSEILQEATHSWGGAQGTFLVPDRKEFLTWARSKMQPQKYQWLSPGRRTSIRQCGDGSESGGKW